MLVFKIIKMLVFMTVKIIFKIIVIIFNVNNDKILDNNDNI